MSAIPIPGHRGKTLKKTAFNERLEEAMAVFEGLGLVAVGMGKSLEITPMAQAEVNQLKALIENISTIESSDERLISIILESADDFFHGYGSAQDAAKVIQSRASVFISEHN